MNKRYFILSTILLFLCIGSFSPFSCKTTITGTVTDSATGNPIAEAIVTIEGIASVTTGIDGTYTFENVPYGDYNISVSVNGYENISVPVNTSYLENGLLGKQPVKDICLLKTDVDDDDIIVVGEHEPVFAPFTTTITEAKKIALFLSDNMTPPEDLSNSVLNELSLIRETYGSFYNQAYITYSPDVEISTFILLFDTATFQQVLSGNYHAWDELNSTYNISEISHDSNYVILRSSDDFLNPYRLIELYSGLPGVAVAEPNYLCGDGPYIHVNSTENGRTYLFVNGWGDCPSGCIIHTYYYFKVLNSSPVFIGSCKSSDPAPDWWTEAN